MADDSLPASAELWKPALGFPNYEVSNLGRLRSVTRRKGSRAMINGGIIRGTIVPQNGKCFRVHVSLRKDGKTFHRKMHSLVLEAFIGPRPDGMEGCHNDGNALNNRLDNLRWDTHVANVADSIRHGTKTPPPIRRGEEHHKSKLKADEIRAIRSVAVVRGTKSRLSRQYGVSLPTIDRIIKREVWSHVD